MPRMENDLTDTVRTCFAREGFVECHVSRMPPDYTAWRARTQAYPDAHYASLTADITSVLDGDVCAVWAVMPYKPYQSEPRNASVSAYYPVSDEAHRAVLRIAESIRALGYRAVGSPPIPYKPILTQSGYAAYGRNGVTAISGYGSRYAVQLILTDAPLTPDPMGPETGPLSRSCASCGACVRACPTGALKGDGTVDVYRCVRARSDEYPMAEEFRTKIGASLYGCDICQDVCPRNAGILRMPVPADLSQALQLERLLAGDVSGLIPYIGKNFARKARMQAKACLIAANLHRPELLTAVQACKDSPVEFVREHAVWAEQRLLQENE